MVHEVEIPAVHENYLRKRIIVEIAHCRELITRARCVPVNGAISPVYRLCGHDFRRAIDVDVPDRDACIRLYREGGIRDTPKISSSITTNGPQNARSAAATSFGRVESSEDNIGDTIFVQINNRRCHHHLV